MKQHDPTGKRALFEAPVSADRTALLRGGPAADGKAALFSIGPRRPGTVVVTCGSCSVRSRVGLVDLGVRLLRLSAWLPARAHPHWMACPACGHHTWCRIDWNA